MLVVKTLQETLEGVFSSPKDIYLSTFTAHNDHIAPVELKPDFSIHSPLARRNRSSDELALWCEEVTIVEDPTELHSRELVPQSTNVSVKRQALQIDMSGTKDGRSWWFVASTRFHADEAVLNDVDTANAVLSSERIKGEEYLHAVSVLLSLRGYSHTDWKTALEFDSNTFWIIRRIFWSGCEFPHVWWGCDVWVFEDSSFIGYVEEILVCRPGFSCRLGDWNFFLSCIGDEGLASWETIVELCRPVWVDDHDWGKSGKTDQGFAKVQWLWYRALGRRTRVQNELDRFLFLYTHVIRNCKEHLSIS